MPYGYIMNDETGSLVPLATEHENRMTIRRMARSGETPDAILRHARAKGFVRAGSGGTWTLDHIQEIVDSDLD